MTRRTDTASPKKTLAAGLALALALTAASPNPVRAEERHDALAAVAFLGFVAAAIVAGSKGKGGRSDGPLADDPGWGPHDPDPAWTEPLPAACQFDIRHGPDRGSWFGQRCLRASYPDWRWLPDHCAWPVALDYDRPDIVAYDAACLADQGYWSEADWAYR